MSVLSHQSYANLNTPLWLSNPVPELVLAGTPEITLSNDNGVLNINGTPLQDVSNWYQYPALNGIILFGDPNNPDTLQSAGGNLYFNGEVLAQAGQISNVADWSLYVAIQNVNMNNFSISNLSGINGSAISNYVTSNWSKYVALQNVDFCNFSLNNVSNLNVSNINGRNDLTVSAIEPIDPTNFADLNLVAGGGNRGRVNITANSGLGGIQGEVRVVANGGSTPLGNVGGLIELTANTPVGAEPTLTSAIKFSAAGINSYAGAIPSVGSLAGYNFIYGNLGVNICAGLPPVLPNTPSTTYIYGTGGVNLESGFGSDVQVKDSDFGARKIIPYYSALAPVSNLIITGRSNLVLANQYVVMTMVNNIDFENSASITSLKSISMSNGAISNLSNLNGIPISNYIVSNWASYTALTNVNLGGCNISNVANLQVNTINGSAYPPAVPNWATVPASQNVDMNNFSISNLVNINGSPYASGVNWSLYVALQSVNMCNFNISNVSNIDLVNINGSPYNPNSFSNWSLAPALQTVNMANFNISNITRAYFGGVSIRQGANVGGSTTAGTETVQLLNSLGGTGSLRVETIAFQNNGGAVNDTILNQVLDALNPPRLTVETSVSTGNTVAYLSDIPANFRSTYDIYVAVNGNDTTGNGGINNPFLTIAKAITFRAGISTSVPVTIHCLSGTYTESFTLATNTYIVGETGTSDPATDPVIIVGTITLSATNTGLFALSVTGNVTTTGIGNAIALNNVTIVSSSTFCVSGNTTCSITSCRLSNTGGGAVNVTASGVFTITDSVLTISSAGANVVQSTGSVSIIRSRVESTSTSTSASSLVRFLNTTTTSNEIRFSKLNYTSTAVDVGGNKCCIQYANTGTNNSQIAQCILECVGAVTGGTRIEAIQKTGAGAVNLTYGGNETVSPASFVASGITRIPMIRMDEGVYGCFSSSITTQVAGANVPTAINHNIIEVNGNSVLGLQSGNIILNRAGNYEVSTSIQFYKTGGGTDLAYFWFRLNGVDVLRSGSSIRLQNNNGEILGNVTAMISANAGDSLTVMFGSADTTLYAQATGSQTTPMVIPAIPSCITSVKLLN